MASRLREFRNIGRKIVAVGRNYREHAVELGNPVPKEPIVFLKPTSSYITQGQAIKLPPNSKELAYEVELGLVIGKTGSKIPKTQVYDYIGGYCLALDMTDRLKQNELKNKGLPWTLAKGFDTSCPVSDFISRDAIQDPQAIDLWLKVNGVTKQQGNTRDMIFDVPTLVSWMSNYFTLEEGDLVLTGTPEGVGPVKAGDTIQCGLSDIVKMTFSVEEGSNQFDPKL